MTLYAQVKKGIIRTIHDWEIEPTTDNWIDISGVVPEPKIGWKHLGENNFEERSQEDHELSEKAKAKKVVSKIDFNALESTDVGLALKAILILLKVKE